MWTRLPFGRKLQTTFCASISDIPEVPELCVQQMCSGCVSRVKDSCWLLQACHSASCCAGAEMEKPQLLLAGSCQELQVLPAVGLCAVL